MSDKLSVVTIAYNEEANIAACINSTRGWADEHIVVDDFSSDRTVEIATRFFSDSDLKQQG